MCVSACVYVLNVCVFVCVCVFVISSHILRDGIITTSPLVCERVCERGERERERKRKRCV